MGKPTIFRRLATPLAVLILVLFLIEFLDELIGGVREAAWPLIRDDLQLSYVHIGLLLSLPNLLGKSIGPFLGILSDSGKRRPLILGGGVVFVFSSFLAAASQSFWPLLIAYASFNPASGAFVSLSQTMLMDLQPQRHEYNMVRWVLVGSVGVVLGPLLFSAFAAAGWGWRILFGLVALLALTGLLVSWRAFSRIQDLDPQQPFSFRTRLSQAVQAAKRKEVLRWLVLLQCAETMMGFFFGYVALYLVDVAGLPPAATGLVVAILTGAGLIGNALIIPLLRRVSSLVLLRYSAALVLLIFIAFLSVPILALKLVLLGLFGFCNAGWYPILKAQIYSALPGQSGTAISLHSISALIGGLIPLLIGILAQHFGLGAAIWLLGFGPVALLIGLPRD